MICLLFVPSCLVPKMGGRQYKHGDTCCCHAKEGVPRTGPVLLMRSIRVGTQAERARWNALGGPSSDKVAAPRRALTMATLI